MNHLPTPTTPLSQLLHPLLSTPLPTPPTIPPPLPLTPHLSLSPLLTTQSTLLSTSLLHLLFRTHLAAHLRLQFSYHLLGSPHFRTALTSALFNPDLPSTERHPGAPRIGDKLGLKLASRGEKTWPPASSELRLALMGILGDSYLASSPPLKGPPNLIHHLSFSIRTLPPTTIPLVLDPSTLYALDFLRLEYRAPPPIDAVLTPGALERYDEVFQFLVRLVRVGYVVERVPWREGVGLMRWKARWFVGVCIGHFCGDVVRGGWDAFEGFLGAVEKRLADEEQTCGEGDDFGDGLGHVGVETVHDRHEQFLESVLFGCLLRKRQQQARERLESLLSYVLQFAELCCEDNNGTESDDSTANRTSMTVDALHRRFSEGLREFMELLRGMVGRRRRVGRGGDGAEKVEDESAERLLVRLESEGVL
ncbi:hypothetical protein P152DRAFT_398953 [Eremomyces bilateralis CBS 781.70]|uniref:Spindle pole body component n=1 Tax=Eremomyces bilateralis CBS 781.70 TaxID=1392243 RepID=A0A6G1FZY0_9PEZI|nr:uncharacterized protein P152DRAFT_398953 [Eremomyces bilateralis CBS 781.70]KAF1811415.1 hypothetical protein P152DRAFT_398953 [Eremomyces bilateralis CBS 781.70]